MVGALLGYHRIMVRRYRPERPLPSRPYRLGRAEGRPADEYLEADFEWGIDLFNAGYYWEAHEQWETLWREAPAGSSERQMLQGLIACAAAALQGLAGRWQGARRLIARAATRFEAAGAPDVPIVSGVDMTALLAACRQMVVCERLDPPPVIVLIH